MRLDGKPCLYAPQESSQVPDLFSRDRELVKTQTLQEIG